MEQLYWKGIAKLIEECGELQQVAGKALLYPNIPHPDGKGPVSIRFIEELADVQAAIEYFIMYNNLPLDIIERRKIMKVQRFVEWTEKGWMG